MDFEVVHSLQAMFNLMTGWNILSGDLIRPNSGLNCRSNIAATFMGKYSQ
jgi:hypothetical protein